MATAIDDRPMLETRHRGLLMAAVMGMSVIQYLDLTIANVALPHMQSSLGASLDTISWVLTSFIIAGVMMMPIAGWLSDRVGSRRLYILAAIGFLISSMLCGAATSLTEMVLFRTLQGISTAFLTPLSQTIIVDINPPSKQPQALALWGMVVMIAPITGPMLGGILTESLNWRWVFFINLPIGIPVLILLVWLLPSRPLVDRKLDRLGFILLAVSLGALQLMLDRGQHKDWFGSWEITIELLVALGALWMFVVHTMTTKNPLFPPALTKNPNFMAATAFVGILGIANVALVSVLPTMFQTLYNYSPYDTGMLMSPRGVGVALTMILSARLMRKIDVRYLIAIGYVIASMALFAMSGWSLDMDSRPIIITSFIMGLGIGLAATPANIIAFATLSPAHRPDGTSVLGLVRNISSSVGISAIVTMLARNTQTSHADIAAHITSYSLPSLDLAALTQRFGGYGGALMQMINGEVTRQALMIAYLDNFYALGWFVLFISPIALLLKPIKIIGAPREPAHSE